MIVKNWGVERGMMLIILRIYLGLLYLSEATDFCCFPPRTAGNDVIFYWIQKICTYKARIKVAFLRTVKIFKRFSENTSLCVNIFHLESE